jgi:phosphomannomutase
VYSTLIPSNGIRILGIDGKPISDEHEQRIRHILQPGWHDIEVDYSKETTVGNTRTTTYSKGSVTFKQRYFFEDGVYNITGKPEEDQIIFTIQRNKN